MQILTQITAWQGGRTAIALGEFDGVHLGHQRLVHRAMQDAREKDACSLVYTFANHPMTIFSPEKAPAHLQTLEEKKACFASMGVGALLLEPFTREYAAQSPETYVKQMVAALHPVSVVIGFNYSFGCRGEGKAADMQAFGKKYGFDVAVIDAVDYEGEAVSSTRIRRCLQAGEAEKARRMLGRPYILSGTIAEGKHLGRQFGFPTANLAFPEEKVIPAYGVYACQAWIEGTAYDAVVNVGRHPTAPEGSPTIEAHLLKAAPATLYGKEMQLSFIQHIREERAFESMESLMHEVERNKQQAEAILQAFRKEEGGKIHELSV